MWFLMQEVECFWGWVEFTFEFRFLFICMLWVCRFFVFNTKYMLLNKAKSVKVFNFEKKKNPVIKFVNRYLIYVDKMVSKSKP